MQKTTKIGLANVHFFETKNIEVERGIEYMIYFDKKQLKDPKMKKLIEKKPKIN